MGNPQDIGVEELAWLAGMLNGDGCFFLNLRETGKSALTSEVRLTLTQTDIALVEKAGIIIEKVTGYFPYIQTAEPHGCGKRQINHLKIMRCELLRKLIPAILPYMAGEKQVKARLLLRFIESRLAKGAPHRIRDDMDSLKIAESFYQYCNRELPPKATAILNDYT